MFWKYLWKSIAFLLIIAMFVGGGYAIYRRGFSQGVVTGMEISEDGGEVDVQPYLPRMDHYYRPYGRPFTLFPFFGLIFGFFLLMAFFGGIRRLTHYRMWKSAGMPCDEEWGRNWHRWHRGPYWGPHPWKGSKPGDEPAEPPEDEETE